MQGYNPQNPVIVQGDKTVLLEVDSPLYSEARDMLARVAQFTCTAPPPEPWRLGEQVDHLGVLVLHGVDHARHMLEMVGRLVLDLGRLARAPRKGPWRDVSGHLYRMGATALPITALVGFLIGVVLAYLMSLQLQIGRAHV